MQVSATQSTVTWDAASTAVRAAVEKAAAIGAAINVAVVDRGGVMVSFLRMPGAPLHSVEIAIDKAYTAASFGLPTGQWHEALESHSVAVQRGIPLRPRFVAFGGGLPLKPARPRSMPRCRRARGAEGPVGPHDVAERTDLLNKVADEINRRFDEFLAAEVPIPASRRAWPAISTSRAARPTSRSSPT
jgi:uncharacterized protein GlcG (DUF336 family)